MRLSTSPCWVCTSGRPGLPWTAGQQIGEQEHRRGFEEALSSGENSFSAVIVFMLHDFCIVLVELYWFYVLCCQLPLILFSMGERWGITSVNKYPHVEEQGEFPVLGVLNVMFCYCEAAQFI